eukprot:229643-Pleurochrysis_carterae.AAC.1
MNYFSSSQKVNIQIRVPSPWRKALYSFPTLSRPRVEASRWRRQRSPQQPPPALRRRRCRT